MKALLKVVGLTTALLVTGIMLQIIASESGEVVVVTTQDVSGADKETRLWVVDHDGTAWLRSGSAESGWYQRLLAKPEISILRGDASIDAVAEPTLDAKDTIDRLMNDKYGWADDYIGMLFGRDQGVPIRLIAIE